MFWVAFPEKAALQIVDVIQSKQSCADRAKRWCWIAWIVTIASALASSQPASLAFAVSFPARSEHSDDLSSSVHAGHFFFMAVLKHTCHGGGRVCVNVQHKHSLFIVQHNTSIIYTLFFYYFFFVLFYCCGLLKIAFSENISFSVFAVVQWCACLWCS